MASFRRTVSLVQRDSPTAAAAAASDGEDSRNVPLPLKAHYNRNYFSLRGYLSPLRHLVGLLMMLDRIPVAVACVFCQRPCKSMDRSRQTRSHLWKSCFSFTVLFILGLIIGILSIDLTENFRYKRQAVYFEDDIPVGLLKNELPDKGNTSRDAPVVTAEVLDKFDMPSSMMDSSAYRNLLIIVTATYVRPFQAYHLNRLAHTLRSVPRPLLWIVVEASHQSLETAKILRETGLMYRHIVCELNESTTLDTRVHQRNAALAHIEKHRLDGIMYFADDDRTYSLDLFDLMRRIRRFGTWPVATHFESMRRMTLEGPICNGSQVIGWHTTERNKISRRFHVDISGFAFSSTILWDPKRWHRLSLEPIRLHETIKESLRDSNFIGQLIEDESQMEGLPDSCSKIMVWHFQFESPDLTYPRDWFLQKNLEVVALLT